MTDANDLTLLSVVIPTCNRDPSLAECLRRLAPGVQTLPADRYEVVVTDDGSTGTAKEMIKQEFPWARWTAGPRRGPAANRNHGVRQAGGEWVAFVDDDCLPTPGWLAGYADAIRDGEAEVLEGLTTSTAYDPLAMEAPVNPGGGYLFSCNMMIGRQIFDRMGGFDEAFTHWNEDVDLGIRLQAAGHPIRFVPAARVEHLPRPYPNGFGMGGRWKSRVQLAIKHQQVRSLWRWLPLHVAKVRASELIQGGLSRHAPAFAVRSGIEVLYVVLHLNQWALEYRIPDRLAGDRAVVKT